MAQTSTSSKRGAAKSGAAAGNGKGRAASPQEKSARRRGEASPAATSEKPPIIDARARRDIAGIVFAVLAVALFLLVAVPSNALVARAAAEGMRTLLGVGAYLLPVLLLVIGGCFLARIDNERVPLRVAIGLTMVFVSLLVLLALFTPPSFGDDTVPSTLFSAAQLESRGGLIGAGIAWAGLSLFGIAVSCVIVFGVIAAGLVIIGFSLSRFFEMLREKRAAFRARGEDDELPAPLAAESAGGRIHQLADALATRSFGPFGRSGEGASDGAGPRASDGRIELRLDPSTRTQVIKGRRQPAEDAKSATAPLTRKLGRTATKDAAASDADAAAVKQTPLAAPKPQEGFELPSFNLLKTGKKVKRSQALSDELAQTAVRLQGTLEDFGILARVMDWVAGPTVTLFEVDLPPGVRVSRVTALNDDIALALAAPGVRIFAPIPGTHYVGIEVPNTSRENVLLSDVLKEATGGPLQMAIGKDVEGNPVICDLARMPHLLIGGTTGSGKSVGINSMIMSMLMRATPAEVRFIMVDPKRVEFTPYNGIPHLYVPVVTEPKEAASALSWGVAEMERRLKVFSKMGARNIGQYNAKVLSGELEDDGAEQLPYIVIIIDELADLMMNVGKEVEFSISRIAQLARAAGIHLIVATQRPSANVVTGLIKSNITNRMSFNVASGLDSRVILDVSGAESLIGNGDLLLSKPEYAKPLRVQGCYVSEAEINEVVSAIKAQGEPEYHTDILKTNLITLGASQPDGSGGSVENDDPLIWEAAEIVVATGLGSTSNIQRKLKVGYSRAGRIMDMLEEKGVVGPANGSKPRDVLVDALELESLKAFEEHDARG